MIERLLAATAIVLSILFAPAVPAQPTPPRPPTLLSVVSFDGGWNLPVWAAQRQGFFEANGVTVQLSYTPNSAALLAGMFDGRYHIAMASIDNFIAAQEGQSEAKIPESPDLFAFMGSDNGFLAVVGAPGVKSFADLKGKTLSVDSMTNGYAYVLRDLVARNGLTDVDVNYVRAGGTSNRYRELVSAKHQGTILRTPFELLARERGATILATPDALGAAYLGTVGAARRSWASANEAAVVGFIRAYKSGVDWIYDKSNRDVVEAMLVANIRDMGPTLARQSYDALLADKGGIYRTLALDPNGIRTVLELRSRYGTPQKTLTDPGKYVDTSYLRKALN